MSERGKGKRQVPDFGLLGSTGLRQFGGFVSEELHKDLAGQKGARIYREMADNDPTVGAVIFALTTLIRQCQYSIQAASDAPEAERGKEFVEEVLSDMVVPFEAVVAEAASMFVYGFAPMELIWKRRDGRPVAPGEIGGSQFDDGKIGLHSISLRAQPTISHWVFDETSDEVLAMVQQPISGGQVTIPMEKLLLFRTTSERGNPEGRSILRSAYRPYYFKKRLEAIEAIGVERDMAGLPVARIPSRYFAADADPEERRIMQVWQELVTTIRRDQREGIVLPSDRDGSGNLIFDLQLLSSAGSRTFDTTKILERYDRAIATSVLADFIFLGQQSVGSFALSSDKTALFATAVGAFTTSMAGVINRGLIYRLWKYNGFNRDHMPVFQFSDIEHRDLQELSAFLSSMSGAGAQLFPDRELENHLRVTAGLPLAPEDDEDMLDEESLPFGGGAAGGEGADGGAEGGGGGKPAGGASEGARPQEAAHPDGEG